MISLEQLQRISLFRHLLPEHLECLASITEFQKLPGNTVLFRQGDASDALFFIFNGQVRVSQVIPGVGEEALAILKTGDFFGEMALIDEEPRSADVLTHTDCDLGIISKEKFHHLLFMNTGLSYELLWGFVRTLSARLRDNNLKMRSYLAMVGNF